MDSRGDGRFMMRFASEGLVIVASILLAFGIDAWWDSRRDRQVLDEHVDAVIAELTQTRADIDRVRRNTATGYEATLQLLRWATQDLGGQDLSGFSNVYVQSMNVGAFLAEDVALTALVESGDVMALGSPELVDLLGAWQNRVEGLELDSSHLERNREETLLNRMIAAGIDATGFFQVMDDGEYAAVAQRLPEQELRFLEDDGIKTGLAMRANRSARLLRDYESALEHLDEVLLLLGKDRDGVAP